MSARRGPRALALAALLAGLAGCDQGTLNLEVGDAPIDDAARVVVRFTAVVLERTDGDEQRFALSPALDIDLAAQVEGATATLLDAGNLDEARYRAVRLEISADGSGTDSFVEEDGGALRPLLIADADRARLRTTLSFEVERLETTRLVLDFDLRKSVHQPDSATAPYELRPSLRLVDADSAGALSGTVSAGLAGAAGCRPAVYVYSGQGVTPDDEGSPLPPLASAIVRIAGADFFYRVPFLPPGNYTAALTCDAAADNPEQDDATTFEATRNVVVTRRATASADFF